MLDSMREHLGQMVQHAPGANRDWAVQKPTESEGLRFHPVETLVPGQADTFRISGIIALLRLAALLKRHSASGVSLNSYHNSLVLRFWAMFFGNEQGHNAHRENHGHAVNNQQGDDG